MGARQVNIFGTTFAVPKGLRKVPKANAFARCVRSQMFDGGPWGNKPARDIKAAFKQATKTCKGTTGS